MRKTGASRRADFALGRLHESAPGALRDEPEAVRLYHRAAERGLIEAQHRLNVLYADGWGVEKD